MVDGDLPWFAVYLMLYARNRIIRYIGTQYKTTHALAILTIVK